MLSVLVVDDETSIRRVLARCLDDLGCRVHTAGTLPDARDEAARTSFDLVFLDLRLGTASGLDLLPELRAKQPDASVVVVTAYADVASAVASMQRGASDVLPKPFSPAQVTLVVERVKADRARRREVEALRAAAGGDEPPVLDSRSPAMQAALTLARQAAASDATILLTGESGTGKTSLARAIHGWSARADGPFVTFAAPSTAPGLLDAELFGHAKGAFTGAIRDAPGRAALADTGTLFLDEIGELPLGLQPKLLRFLQSRAYERVGDGRELRADVRLVAATNRDLHAAVAAGTFREDLFYRLSVIEVALPPLRDRAEDVVGLARHLLGHFARRYGRPGLPFMPEAEAALAAHGWPGNLRELRNAVERAVILAGAGPVEASLLPFGAGAPSSSAPRAGDALTLAELDAAHVRAVLARTRSYEEAAATLGIDQATLWRKRKAMGLG